MQGWVLLVGGWQAVGESAGELGAGEFCGHGLNESL